MQLRFPVVLTRVVRCALGWRKFLMFFFNKNAINYTTASVHVSQRRALASQPAANSAVETLQIYRASLCSIPKA